MSGRPHPLPSAAGLPGLTAFLLFLLLFPLPALARPEKFAEATSPAGVKPGSITLVKSAEVPEMSYFLRVPKRYDPSRGARLIVFLHGSNMNGLEYLRSFEAKKWGVDDILCCPNGESGGDPAGRNNFGFGSGIHVAAVTREVQKTFRTTIAYLGGHSQGAFLTYDVILNHPGLFKGAFPMAGDCWIQSEPVRWEDQPELLKQQQETAIAVIHGKADPVVPFSQGEHAFDCFLAMGWTRLRFFAPEKLNHMFMAAPVDEALEWLDAMNGLEGKRTPALAAKWARDGEWGWAWHAAGPSGARKESVRKAAEAAAAKALPAVQAAMRGAPMVWVPQFSEFRRIHGETATAAPLIAEYQAARSQERPAAAGLFQEAQSLFRSRKKDEARAVLEKLSREAPHTCQGYFAIRWLAADP